MNERTFTIIKPDSVEKGNTGKIIAHLESEGFTILAGRMTYLSQSQAEGFYAIHKERPFFSDLVAYMTSGPVWVMALERENAVPTLRKVMGATNPADADEGHSPKIVWRVHRTKCGPRVRLPGERSHRNRFLLSAV